MVSKARSHEKEERTKSPSTLVDVVIDNGADRWVAARNVTFTRAKIYVKEFKSYGKKKGTKFVAVISPITTGNGL